MGPASLTAALPRGGQYIDSYPAELSNYMDGMLEKHWISNKAEGCIIKNSKEVPRLVC
jgi:hypothetical protein